MNPFDYSLCRDTVTLYRHQDNGILRQVLENVLLSGSVSTPTETYGKSRSKKFLLMIPGNRPVRCADRIYRGVGPETVDWDRFIPAVIPELYEVSFVKPCCWEGEITHWEAGNRKETL